MPRPSARAAGIAAPGAPHPPPRAEVAAAPRVLHTAGLEGDKDPADAPVQDTDEEIGPDR